MKAYQVFKGYTDNYDNQQYELVSTYLDRERALQHCKDIAESTKLYGDNFLEEGQFYDNGKYKVWTLIGWSREDIAKFEEIEITE
jgi:hypothetical protein